MCEYSVQYLCTDVKVVFFHTCNCFYLEMFCKLNVLASWSSLQSHLTKQSV